ncbi:MAG: 2Fe-2S iron-sulfur cluster-binding protein [Parafilimonas sp.]
MPGEKQAIHFTAFCDGEKYELETYAHEYRNLMILLYDKIFIEGFGECGGMGRCGTCLVKITGSKAVNTFNRNEESTLHKTGIAVTNMHLACQVLVDENLENINIEIMGAEI